MSGLGDELAVVTGASRGIGRAIALELGARGATVVGTATSDEGAARIASDLESARTPGTGRVLDVADEASVETFMEGIEELGRPTILVNNAGITRDNLLMRMRPEEWQAVIETNLGSVYRMSRACLRPMMKARRGRIINIASVVGAIGNAGQANYAAAKAGMEGFARSLAREIGTRGITVNTVAPGFIDTDMTRALSEDQRAALLAQIPLERLGAPEDVARTVAFLASADAAYITGQTLHVNGGLYMG